MSRAKSGEKKGGGEKNGTGPGSQSPKSDSGAISAEPPVPRYHLDVYRKFMRDAAPYVSLIAGRKIKPSESETWSDDEVRRLALLIDSRVAELKPLV